MTKMGHNSDLNDAEKEALFVAESETGYELHLKVKAAQAALTQHHKSAKAKGIKTAKMRVVYKALDEEDEKLPGAHLQDHFDALAAFGFVTNKQLSLFTTEKDSDTIADQGHRAGVMNKDRTSGFAKGSPDDKAWLKAYDKGRTDQQKNLASAMEKIKEKEAADNDDGSSDMSDDLPDTPPDAA